MTRTAIATASYSNDLDRCRLLCESMDQHMLGDWVHYILVSRSDVALFRPMEGPRRQVVDETDLLPAWLFMLPDPFSLMKRKIWLSPFSIPLRGWHVQQLRRLALSRYIEEKTMLSADSDVVMIRDYDPADLWQDGKLGFYRIDNTIDTATHSNHLKWMAHSTRLLGCQPPQLPTHDYISSLIPWRTDTCRTMLDYIEARHQRHWVRAMVRSRTFSECIIYGRYVDEIMNSGGHFRMPNSLCHSLWLEGSYLKTKAGLKRFLGDRHPHHVGLQIQSFIGHELDDIRAVTQMLDTKLSDRNVYRGHRSELTPANRHIFG
jgi:hypothetical protein